MSTTLRGNVRASRRVDEMNIGKGAIYYVHSGTGDDNNSGENSEEPLATLAAAYAACTANQGDVIVLMPGHAETYSTTGTKLTADKAGVKIIGLGRGPNRPTFTFGHTGATWAISAAGHTLENLLFVTGTDGVTTFMTISAADWKLIDIETRDTTDVEVITDITVTAAADRGEVRRFFKNGYTGGNANARVFSLAGVDRCLFEDCRFITKVTTAVIGFVTTACTAIEIKNSNFLVDSTSLTKNVVDTVSGSTWLATGCADLSTGAGFSGGSAAALAGDDVSAVAAATASVGTLVSTANSHLVVANSSVVSVGAQAASIGTQLNTSDLTSTIVSAAVSIITACSNA